MQFPQIQGYLLSADYQKLIPLQQQLKTLINQYNIQADPRTKEAIVECIQQHQKLRLSSQLATYLNDILMRYSYFSYGSATSAAKSVGTQQQFYTQLEQLLEIQRSIFMASPSVFGTYVEAARLSNGKAEASKLQLSRQLDEKQTQEIKDGIQSAQMNLQFKYQTAGQLKLSADKLNDEYEARLKSITTKVYQITQELAGHGFYQIEVFRSKVYQLYQRMDQGIRKYAELQQQIDRCREQNGQANPREEDLIDQLRTLAEETREREQEYEERVGQLRAQLQDLEQQVKQSSPKKDVRKDRDALKQELAQVNEQIDRKRKELGK